MCLQMRVAVASVLLYSAAAVVFTLVDRLDHAHFAHSEFCASDELQKNAGVHGSRHCLGQFWRAFVIFAPRSFFSFQSTGSSGSLCRYGVVRSSPTTSPR